MGRPALPGAVGQLAVKGGAARDGGLGLLEQLLALQPVRCAGHRGGPGQGLQGRGGHPVPRGVPSEGGFVLAGGAFAVQFVLHHGDPAELRTPPVKQEELVKGGSEPWAPLTHGRVGPPGLRDPRQGQPL